jgi:hypothetical protein
MYKIIGADGKEYGPVNLQQLKQWASEGRVNPQTRVQGPQGGEWKAAAELPELASLMCVPAPRIGPPPVGAPGPMQPPQNGLATTSLVLGILSMVCFGVLTGIPAIICGHIARGRARSAPMQHGGAGMALAGLIMGYISLVMTFVILPAMLLPALSKAKARAQQINCMNNMKQIGVAFKVWALDHTDQYPFSVSVTNGGTLELCSPGSDGADRNSWAHFLVLSNELGTPKVLVCPADSAKTPAVQFPGLQAANVTYQVHSGEGVNDSNPQAVLAVCPIHGTVILSDGSVQLMSKYRKQR